ncbi:MAG: formylglycine-generating enzyme family protein [Bacteroidota bacterium]
MFRGLLAIALPMFLLAGPVAAQPAAQPWPERLYNPQAAAGDLVLPMPCGGAMAFRRVDVPAEGVLDDRKVTLGGHEDQFAYAENSRADFIVGGFTDKAKPKLRYYYLGKYEVTALQYDAMGGNCPSPSEEGRLPKVSVTWAEAVAFASKYGAWLAREALNKLPSEDGSPGFVRLPTEAEWEYAARGGLAVSDSVFVQQTFPMPDGPARYVWYQGTESANNELNVIGLLKPNPLGLHDVLGNAGEFVLDPFRLNKLSRLHGQAGGATVKGGDYRTPLDDIRSAAREEFVPIDKQGERRSPTTGFRVALVAPGLPSTQRLSAIRAAWADLPKTSGVALAEQQEDPVKEVDVLAKAVEDPVLRQRVQNLATVIKANIQTRNEQRDRAARSGVRVGAYLARKLSEDKRIVAFRENQLKTLTQVSDSVRDGIKKQLEADKAALDFNLAYYIDTVTQLTSEYPEGIVSSQADILKREFEARKLEPMVPFIDAFAREAALLRKDGKLDPKSVLGAIPG